MGVGFKEKNTPMKNIINTTVVIPGVTAATLLLLSFVTVSNVEFVVGFSAVLALLGIATLEYRINWKRLLGL